MSTEYNFPEKQYILQALMQLSSLDEGMQQ